VRASRVLIPAVVALLGFGFALLPLAQGRIFFYWDNAHQHYPQTVFLHDALRNGAIPQWFPAVGFGFPTVAEGQAAHYHPFRLLFALVFDPPAAMMWEFGFCFAVAGLSTYAFLRQFRLTRWACLLGAYTQMFCGFSVIFVRNLALHRSLCLLPLGMLLSERWVRTRAIGPALGFSGVLALQLLSGHPTMAMITIVGTTLYVVVRLLQRAWNQRLPLPEAGGDLAAALTCWIPAVAFAFVLAAIQVIPTALHARDSIRQGGLTFEYAVRGLSAQPGFLVQAAFPYAFEQGDRLRNPAPEGPEINLVPFSNMYVGILPLLFAGAALWWRRRWPDPAVALAITFLVATAFALGPMTPLFPALWSVPGLDSMRYPNRFLLLSSFCLSCLAAVGLHHLAAASRLRRHLRLLAPVLIGGAGLVVLGALLWVRRPDFRVGTAVSLFLWLAAGLLTWLLLRSRRRRMIVLPVIIAAAAVDLYVFRQVSDYAPTYSVSEATDPPVSAKIVQQGSERFRVLSLVSFESGMNRNEQFRELLMANLSAVWGIDSADAWGSLFSARYYALREALVWELTHSPGSAAALAGFLGALNVEYVLSPTPVELTGWKKIHSLDNSHVWKNPHVQPRAFLVGTAVLEDLDVRPEWEDRANRRLEPYRQMVVDWFSRRGDAQIVDHIMARATDYTTTAVVDAAQLPHLTGSQPEFRVEDLTGRETDVLRFRVQSDRPALMVVSNSYAPGWKATVNGAETEILRTNWIVQSVLVGAGESDVVLSYSTPGWRAGAAVSLISVLLLLGVLSGVHRRLRHRPGR
jgi:membrane protein YfhO